VINGPSLLQDSHHLLLLGSARCRAPLHQPDVYVIAIAPGVLHSPVSLLQPPCYCHDIVAAAAGDKAASTTAALANLHHQRHLAVITGVKMARDFAATSTIVFMLLAVMACQAAASSTG
jgi:hypothetical protein